MAKRRTAAPAMACPTGSCGPKCIIMGLLSAAFAGVGLLLLVGGVLKQMEMMPWTNTWLWYFGGFVLWCIAKCCKRKACPMCA